MKTAAVIIVCNGEKFITKQLDNIYDTVDEIIIAEGADRWFSKVINSRRSTDKTIEFIKAYQADKDPDKKIKLIYLNTDKNSMVREAVKQTGKEQFARNPSLRLISLSLTCFLPTLRFLPCCQKLILAILLLISLLFTDSSFAAVDPRSGRLYLATTEVVFQGGVVNIEDMRSSGGSRPPAAST